MIDEKQENICFMVRAKAAATNKNFFINVAGIYSGTEWMPGWKEYSKLLCVYASN